MSQPFEELSAEVSADLTNLEKGLLHDAPRIVKQGADKMEGLWQDAQGRWRNTSGQFASEAEKMAAGVARSFEGLGDQIQRFAGQMQLAGGVMVGAFGGAITYAVKSASDLSEAVNKVQVVFGESAKSIQDFAQSSATNLGLSQQAALDYAGSLGNMFVSMKLTAAGSAELSKGILSLAADIASFNNIKVTEALDKLKSGLQGEAEPLRSVGVLLSDVAIKAKAMEVGLKGASDKLSEQQKVLLRYLTILDQTEKAQGDFARTATGMANSSRILAAQFEDLTAKIGDKFLGAANNAMGVAVQLLSVINNLPAPILAAGAAVLVVGAALGAAALTIGTVVAILGGPLTLAFIGIAAQAAALAIGISQNWDRISEMTQGLGINWQSAFKFMAQATGYLVDVISAATRQIIMLFDVVVSGAKILANGVVAAFNSLSVTLGSVLKSLATGDMIGFAVALTTGFQGAISSVGAAVGSDLKALMGRVSGDIVQTGKFLGGQTAKAFGAAFDKGVESAKSFDFGKLKKQIEDELKRLTGAAAGAGDKAGKGAARAAAKAMLDSVNEMLDTLKAGVKVSKDHWDKMGADTKASLTAQSIVIKQFNEALKNLAITRALSSPKSIDVAVGDFLALSEAIKKVEAAGIKVKIVLTDVSEGLKLAAKSSSESARSLEVSEEWGEQFAKNLEMMRKELLQQTEDSGKAFKKQIDDMVEATKAAKEWGKVMTDAVRRVKDDIRANVGDGIGGVLIALAEKFKWNLTKIDGWAGGIIEIVGALPGKVGDKLRGVTDAITTWANRIDAILKSLHKVFNSIPDGLGAAIGKVIEIFKGGTSAVITGLDGLKVSTADFSQGIGDLMKFASQESQASFNAISTSANNSSKEVDKAARAVVASIAAVATFAATRNQGKFAGVLGGAAAGAQIGSLFGPVGTIVGAGAGAILGLFGSGKSSAQKRAEEEAKQRAALDMQRAAADIMSAQMEGLKKGLEFLQGLQGFAEVPRKAIKRFFNQIEMVLTLFAEMAAKFKAETIEQSKAVAEIMSGGFSALLSGADLINAIKTVAAITDQNIADFVATTMKIITKWVEAANTIELGTAKFTGKIADKLTTSFEFLKIVPEVIKGFAESVKLDDAQIDSVFASVQKIVQKMKGVSEAERGLELNKAGASAEAFQKIFASIKEAIDAIKGAADIQQFEASIWDNLFAFVQKMVDSLSASLRLMDTATQLAANFKGLADAMKANVLSGMESIRIVAGALSTLLSGGGAASSVTLEGRGAPSSGVAQSRAGGALASVTQYNTITIDPTKFKDIQEMLDWIKDMFSPAGGLAQAAQSS